MIIELAVGAGVVLMGALALRRAKRRQERQAALPEEGSSAGPGDADAAIESALAEVKKKSRKGGGDADIEIDDDGNAVPRSKAEKKKKKKKGKRGHDGHDGHDGEDDDDGAADIRPAGPRGLRVGDVLLYADTELWLAGEVHLDEEGFALSIFTSPGSTRGSHVAQVDAEAREVAFLEATTEVPDGSVPEALPIAGLRLKLRRRGHAAVRSCGEQLPHVTERAEYTILGGPGGKTLIVIDFVGGDRLALHGERVGREMYELLPGAD